MIYLRQSTASQSVLIGPFVDDTDGKTAEAALTINASDIRLSKNGGNMAAKNSGGGTHDEAGWYTITLDATDTNTVGRLQASVHVAGALPVWADFQVLEEAIYDALFASAATGFDASGRVDIGKFGGTTVTARDIGASVLLSNGTGAGQVSLSSGTVTVGTNNDKTGYSLTAVTGLGNQTANITGNLSGSVGSVSGAVGSVTGNVGGNVVGSVGSISGVTFPANFGNLAITVTTGKVTVGTNDDKAGYSISGTITTLDALDTSQGSQHATTQAAIADVPTVAEFEARTLAAADYFDPAADTVANVTAVGSVSGSVGSVTGNVGGNVVGSIGSISGVTFPTNFGDLAITATTGRVTVGANEDKTGYSLTPTTGLGNQTADITGNLSGSVGSVTGAVGSVTGAVGSVTGNVGGNVVGSVGSVLGGINTAGGTIQTLDALDTAQDSQHATTQAAIADVPTVAEFNARTLAAADYFDPATDTVANVTTVGSVTNLTISAGAVLATGTHNPQSGDAFARLGVPAGVSVSADVAAVKADTGTLVSRITSTLFSGITSLGQWLGAMAGKQAADATAQAEIRATGAGSGTYDATTDSQEALRGRGDAAWITATGFSTFNPATDGVTLADGSHGGTAAVLTLERVIVASATEDQPAVSLTGNGAGPGLRSVGGLSGNGANFAPGMAGHGVYAGGSGTGSGIYAYAAQSGHGFSAVSSLAPGIYARTESGYAGDADFGDFRCVLGSEDAITAASLAASAVAEIQSGLSTLTAEQVNAEILDVLDADTLVAGVTIAESLRRIGAITSGQVSGAGSGTETFLDYAQSANSIAITVDSSGNRTGVAYN